jgi:hypothetical protein
MAGLEKMVEIAGGLEQLGWDGMLRHLAFWYSHFPSSKVLRIPFPFADPRPSYQD